VYNIRVEELIQMLKSLLADTVALRHKAHGFHWNVEGDDFPQYHAFFEMLYSDYDSAIDPLAEYIRALDSYAPFRLSRFVELTSVPDTDVTSDPMVMVTDLKMSNDMVTAKLIAAFDIATAAKKQGIANFLADRQSQHEKWSWQMRSILKENEID